MDDIGPGPGDNATLDLVISDGTIKGYRICGSAASLSGYGSASTSGMTR